MKKTLLVLTLGMALSANAQIGFEKIDGIKSKMHFADSNHFIDGKLMYTQEVVNGKDIEFTIFNPNFSINRKFTIHDCASTIYSHLIAFAPLSSHYLDGSALTQNLFNDDEKFEVLRPTIQNNTITKIEILSEDETLLGELPLIFFDSKSGYIDDAWISGFHTNEATYKYLAAEKENNKYEYYRVTNTPQNSISFQKVDNNSFAFPNPVKRNSGLAISTAGMELSANSAIEVTNMSGQLVFRKEIKEGEKETSIPTRNLTSGQYIYSILSNNKSIESGKILVK